MIISFQTKALRHLSESKHHAKLKMGDPLSKSLHARLADLVAVKNPIELPLGFTLLPDFPKRFSVSLGSKAYAVFESNHLRDREAPLHQGTKWKGVSRIKLVDMVVKND